MPPGKNLGPAAKKYEAEAKAQIRLHPLLIAIACLVVGVIVGAILF